jgi:hypothetical protein
MRSTKPGEIRPLKTTLEIAKGCIKINGIKVQVESATKRKANLSMTPPPGSDIDFGNDHDGILCLTALPPRDKVPA